MACCGICYKVYLSVSLESLDSKEMSRLSRKRRQVNSSLNIVFLPVGIALRETTGPSIDAGSHGDHPLQLARELSFASLPRANVLN